MINVLNLEFGFNKNNTSKEKTIYNKGNIIRPLTSKQKLEKEMKKEENEIKILKRPIQSARVKLLKKKFDEDPDAGKFYIGDILRSSFEENELEDTTEINPDPNINKKNYLLKIGKLKIEKKEKLKPYLPPDSVYESKKKDDKNKENIKRELQRTINIYKENIRVENKIIDMIKNSKFINDDEEIKVKNKKYERVEKEIQRLKEFREKCKKEKEKLKKNNENENNDKFQFLEEEIKGDNTEFIPNNNQNNNVEKEKIKKKKNKKEKNEEKEKEKEIKIEKEQPLYNLIVKKPWKEIIANDKKHKKDYLNKNIPTLKVPREIFDENIANKSEKEKLKAYKRLLIVPEQIELFQKSASFDREVGKLHSNWNNYSQEHIVWNSVSALIWQLNQFIMVNIRSRASIDFIRETKIIENIYNRYSEAPIIQNILKPYLAYILMFTDVLKALKTNGHDVTTVAKDETYQEVLTYDSKLLRKIREIVANQEIFNNNIIINYMAYLEDNNKPYTINPATESIGFNL